MKTMVYVVDITMVFMGIIMVYKPTNYWLVVWHRICFSIYWEE